MAKMTDSTKPPSPGPAETADWILRYLENECALDGSCVSPADFRNIVNAISNGRKFMGPRRGEIDG